jgi:spectinomycin phosphotransferase
MEQAVHTMDGRKHTDMLEKPDIEDEKILACLQDEFGLSVTEISFLPLGADPNTAAYRVVAEDGMVYFLKLRRGTFDETSVTLPKFLSDLGLSPIIAPLATRTGQLWGNLEAFSAILYPFVEGRDGYEVGLSDRHWNDLGKALKSLHSARVPPAVRQHIRPETYPADWRESVKMFLERVREETWDDPAAVKAAALLRARRREILDLVSRADRLAQALRARSPELVVCHSDIHAGNILISTDGVLFIVDWDDPILAPKERDLMFIGGGQMGDWRTSQEEEALFYPAYGETRIDASALAYYRYERIIEDISVICEQLLTTNEGGEDREQAFRYLASNFLPGQTIDIAYRADRTLTND